MSGGISQNRTVLELKMASWRPTELGHNELKRMHYNRKKCLFGTLTDVCCLYLGLKNVANVINHCINSEKSVPA